MPARAPRGFRDILPVEARRRERLAYEVGSFFDERGYGLIETPVVENLSVLETCAHCDVDNSFRFSDVDGSLLALRSDVTVPIARVVATRFRDIPEPYRLRYNAEIFREEESLRGLPRAVRQLGVEFIGATGPEADAEVIELAIGAAKVAGIGEPVVCLSSVGVFSALADRFVSDDALRDELYRAAHRGDFVSVESLCAGGVDAGTIGASAADAIVGIVRVRGGEEALGRVRSLLGDLAPDAGAALDSLDQTFELLKARGLERYLRIDFSVMRSFSYYTGFVFEVYAPGVGLALGGGGRYDQALAAFGRDLNAAGFAFEVDALTVALDRGPADSNSTVAEVGGDAGVTAPRPLRIAIPKGLLYQGSLDLLERAGYQVDEARNPGRQLMVSTPGLDIIISKPTDVAIYVANGAVDCGIGGRDILVEADYPMLELVNLRFGACTFVVAQPESASPSLSERATSQGIVRAATKYPRLTQRFFDRRGIPVEIVKLNGNIELAPLIGVADVIVDITATGTTLRQNNLAIVEEVLESTARFVANDASARTDARVGELATTLYELVREG